MSKSAYIDPAIDRFEADQPMLQTPRHFWMAAFTLATLFFAAIAPTLLWLEFSNSPEALNVATAMEIRRGDSPWLVPSLQGQTRLHKPPLTAWITAAAISSDTMELISSSEPAERQRGFLWLQWQTRWPALLAGCVLLLATASIGRTLAGPTCGIVSLLVAGSSLLFLRFSRYATTDIQLAMWVAVANAFLLEAMLHRRKTLGYIAGGAALGLAMLSKGPVALVQSVVPIALWWFYARLDRSKLESTEGRPRLAVVPIILGTLAFLAVAVPWFAVVLMREPGAMSVWWAEVTREGATESKPGAWYTYFSLIPYLSPWFAFMIGGASIAILHRDRRELLPLFLLIVPIIIMSFAKDRAERYLLPMLPAAAVLAGIGITELLSIGIVAITHWIILAAIAVGFPLVMLFVKPPWYPTQISAAAAGIAAIIIVTGIIQQRRTKSAMIFVSVLLMLALQALFITGYRNTREGSAELRPMADHAAALYPYAEAFNAHPRGKRPPPELGVYLNRVVKWTDDPSALTPGAVPKLLFMLQDDKASPPTAPGGWTTVEVRRRDKDFWWVFVLPAAQKG